MYYNRKYKSKGHVFQSSYRASHIDREAYLAHITRYIHLNPRSYRRYRWSSYGQYIGEKEGMAHPERVHSRSQLLDRVWGDHVFIEERTVDVHVKRLREALSPVGCAPMIETVRGAGYRLRADGGVPPSR